ESRAGELHLERDARLLRTPRIRRVRGFVPAHIAIVRCRANAAKKPADPAHPPRRRTAHSLRLLVDPRRALPLRTAGADVQDGAVLHHVVLPLEAQLSRLAGPVLATGGDEVCLAVHSG